SAAGGTADPAGAGGGPVAVAGWTGPVGPEPDLGLGPESRLRQRHLDPGQDVTAPRPGPGPAPEGEGIRERPVTEHRTQDVVDPAEAASEQVTQVDGVAPVIAAAPIGIGQDLVGLRRLLEPLLGMGI